MSKDPPDKTQTDPYRLTSSEELAPGTEIGRYVVERCLGVGGMGAVYAARDRELARRVALKIVQSHENVEAMQERLSREAKAMARLTHANVVPIYDIGRHEGQVFLVMELIDGETLRAWVGKARPWRDVVRAFVAAGHGLAAAHDAGLLHRDFKPDNVLIDQDGEPRITDFGLAREIEVDETGEPALVVRASDAASALSRVTVTGSLAGTLAYMAPERVLAARTGTQADQFGYCVALFEVLHGARPFEPEKPTPDAWVAEVRDQRIAKPARERKVPGWLHAVVLRGMAFDPAKRWPSMHELVRVLERGLHRRRRRIQVVVAALAVAGAVTGVVVRCTSPPSPDCRTVALKGNDATTIAVCGAEYRDNNDPQVGWRLADALRRTGSLDDAERIARELLATEVRPDALQILGKIAGARHRPDEAVKLLRLAGDAYRDRQRWANAAAALLATAEFSSDFIEQLLDLDRAVTDAQRAPGSATEANGRLAAAVTLSLLGVRASALEEVARADALLTRPAGRITLDIQRGNVYQNLEEHAPAVAAFERALANAEKATIASSAMSAHLNLAYSLVESDRLADAAHQLQQARESDPDDLKLPDRLSIEARIEARGGHPARAAELVERALARTDAGAHDDLLELEVQRAEIALQQGDFVQAERWARRAITSIEKLRSTNPPVELRSWMIVDRRAPYEVLFASLAAQGDAAQALLVFDRYRGLGVLAALSHGEPSPVPGAPGAVTHGVGFPTAELARLLRSLQAHALATPATDTAILDIARSHPLLALVVARGELWRIAAQGGRFGVARIGSFSKLVPQLEQFRAAPGDRAVAAALGALLVPSELARPGAGALGVVLDEPLAGLPVAALRVGDQPLIAARPIVSAARVSALTCAVPYSGRRPVVRLDARSVRAALFGAQRNSRLQVAAVIQTDALGESLVLGDGAVRALDLAGGHEIAEQVVLEMPGSGSTGTTRLAMAFVAAGADQVIAAVRPVSSAAVARLTDRLARTDRSDLVRELARIQLASANDQDMLGFAVFGRASCDTRP